MCTKIFKLTVFIVIAQIFLYACCTDTYNVFVNVVDLTVRDESDDDITSVTNADFSLFAKVEYDRMLVSSIIKQSDFINTANATTCDREDIVIKRIENVELFADVSLFGIDAGNSLNDRVRTGFGYFSNNFDISNMIAALNLKQTNFSQEYYLTFDTEVPVNTTVTFTLVSTFEDNTQLTRISTPVTFE